MPSASGQRDVDAAGGIGLEDVEAVFKWEDEGGSAGDDVGVEVPTMPPEEGAEEAIEIAESELGVEVIDLRL